MVVPRKTLPARFGALNLLLFGADHSVVWADNFLGSLFACLMVVSRWLPSTLPPIITEVENGALEDEWLVSKATIFRFHDCWGMSRIEIFFQQMGVCIHLTYDKYDKKSSNTTTTPTE